MSSKVRATILIATTTAAGLVFAGDTSAPAAKVLPFRIGIEFTAEEVIVTALDGGEWAMRYGSSAKEGRSCYVGPGQISGDLRALEARQYSFRAEFGVDGIKLTSICGTNWGELAYRCADQSVCRIIVSEDGVIGQ